MVFCSALTFWSCSEDSQDPSKVTYYITYTMNGDEVMTVPVGGTFDDPGVVAMEGETDVTANVKIDSNVDTNKVGVYTVTYSATNVDGFDSSISRTVAVYDPAITEDMSGTYTVDPAQSNRDANGSVSNFANSFTVTLTALAPGVYEVSDFLAGWYDQGSGYGSTYAAIGYCTLDGDKLTSLTNASYDPATSTVTWDADYAGMLFHVVMNK